MPKVSIMGWKPQFKKVSHTKLIRDYTGLPLRPAKEYTDRVLLGETVVVEVSTPVVAERFVSEARKLGAVAEVVNDPKS